MVFTQKEINDNDALSLLLIHYYNALLLENISIYTTNWIAKSVTLLADSQIVLQMVNCTDYKSNQGKHYNANGALYIQSGK